MSDRLTPEDIDPWALVIIGRAVARQPAGDARTLAALTALLPTIDRVVATCVCGNPDCEAGYPPHGESFDLLRQVRDLLRGTTT